MSDFLLENLPRDLDPINAASRNVDELERVVYMLHIAVRYCEVSRLTKAIEKLELALNQDKDTNVVKPAK